jgi:hypothetical protein
MKIESCGEIFGNFSITFHVNRSSVSQFIPCREIDGQTDMTNLIVVLRIFVNTPKTARIQDNYIRHNLVKFRHIKKHLLHS